MVDDLVLALAEHASSFRLVVYAVVHQQGVGVPQVLAVPLTVAEVVAVVVILHQELSGRRQLVASKELEVALPELLWPLLLVAVRARLRVHVVLVRLAQSVHVLQALDLAAFVLADLALVVAFLLVFHVPEAGGAELSPLHHPPVARLLVILLVARIALLLAGWVTALLQPPLVRESHQSVGLGFEQIPV